MVTTIQQQNTIHQQNGNLPTRTFQWQKRGQRAKCGSGGKGGPGAKTWPGGNVAARGQRPPLGINGVRRWPSLWGKDGPSAKTGFCGKNGFLRQQRARGKYAAGRPGRSRGICEGRRQLPGWPGKTVSQTPWQNLVRVLLTSIVILTSN